VSKSNNESQSKSDSFAEQEVEKREKKNIIWFNDTITSYLVWYCPSTRNTTQLTKRNATEKKFGKWPSIGRMVFSTTIVKMQFKQFTTNSPLINAILRRQEIDFISVYPILYINSSSSWKLGSLQSSGKSFSIAVQTI
jgi:hypothetical protein